MALARARRSDRGFDYWPGFVDALSTLILGIVFMLSVFVVVQFFLSQEVTSKDQALDRLNSQISQLTELLSLEKTGKTEIASAADDLARRYLPSYAKWQTEWQKHSYQSFQYSKFLIHQCP